LKVLSWGILRKTENRNECKGRNAVWDQKSKIAITRTLSSRSGNQDNLRNDPGSSLKKDGLLHIGLILSARAPPPTEIIFNTYEVGSEY